MDLKVILIYNLNCCVIESITASNESLKFFVNHSDWLHSFTRQLMTADMLIHLKSRTSWASHAHTVCQGYHHFTIFENHHLIYLA